jgi:hypothetical protein
MGGRRNDEEMKKKGREKGKKRLTGGPHWSDD